jgi:geranylgeranyl diphosphate synthase, type II
MVTRQADELSALLRHATAGFEAALSSSLNDPAVPPELQEALRYSSLDGGKRVRPALVMLSAQAVAQPLDWRADPMPAAVAIELVHCYSLVHDDLPAMDDDMLRRGRATCHVKFGQAMAILVGDALLTRAFEVLSRGVADPAIARELVIDLALAAGPAGMVAGQVADMGLCRVTDGIAGHQYIHQHKTGAMVQAAVKMGGRCAGAGDSQLALMARFGEKIGLAFQVTDDLLDATASAQELGKTPGKDAQSGKQTYVSQLGLEETARLAQRLTDEALAAVEPLGMRAQGLKELATLLARRQH